VYKHSRKLTPVNAWIWKLVFTVVNDGSWEVLKVNTKVTKAPCRSERPSWTIRPNGYWEM